MAHPIVSTPRLEAARARLRPVVEGLGAIERPSHGSPTYFTGEGRSHRTFASLHDERERGEGRLCLWFAAPEGLQEALVAGDREKYFVPPYVGHRGWAAVRLDRDPVDWDEVAGLLEDAFAFVAGRPT